MPGRLLSGVVLMTSMCLLLLAASQVPAAQATKPTVEQIAQQVGRVYSNAAYIEIEGTSERPGEEIKFKYEGTQDSFRTTSWQSGEPTGAFSLHGGRVQEWVPKDPKNLVLCYDAERESGIDHLVYSTPNDCNYGVMFELWIGSKSRNLESLQRGLPQSTLSGEAELGKYRCWVLERVLTFAPREGEKEPAIVTHTYYIDQTDFVLRRWETKRPDGVQRRDFTRMQISDTAPVKDWTVIPPRHTPSADEVKGGHP